MSVFCDEAKKFVMKMLDESEKKKLRKSNYSKIIEVSQEALFFCNKDEICNNEMDDLAEGIVSIHNIDFDPDPAYELVKYVTLASFDRNPNRICDLMGYISDKMIEEFDHEDADRFFSKLFSELRVYDEWDTIIAMAMNSSSDMIKALAVNEIEKALMCNFSAVLHEQGISDIVKYLQKQNPSKLAKILGISEDDFHVIMQSMRNYPNINPGEKKPNINKSFIWMEGDWGSENISRIIFNNAYL